MYHGFVNKTNDNKRHRNSCGCLGAGRGDRDDATRHRVRIAARAFVLWGLFALSFSLEVIFSLFGVLLPGTLFYVLKFIAFAALLFNFKGATSRIRALLCTVLLRHRRRVEAGPAWLAARAVRVPAILSDFCEEVEKTLNESAVVVHSSASDTDSNADSDPPSADAVTRDESGDASADCSGSSDSCLESSSSDLTEE
eukprot:gnl/Chilomastix_cuspidata/3015.p1 GENE.gnl/Chilomastix_cuspidata/3015~~gnl/Chilomastix_cuspidata/3015.p1  ORF type:complete len:197 (+),score=20.73 gnl/Chilomastix_cuspidata/3015:104-694(+)